MYNQIFLSIFIFLGISVKAQKVGVFTENPKATLEAVSKPNDISYYDGILPPQLTGNELNNKTYTAEQLGAIVYVTQSRTDADKGQTAKVTTADLYIFDGTSWLPMSLQPAGQNQPMVHSVSSVNNTFTSEVNGASANISLVKTITHQLQDNDLKTQINGVISAPIAIPNIYTRNGTASGDVNTIKLNNHNLSIHNTVGSKNNQVNILGVLSLDLLAKRLGVGITNPIATVDVRSSYYSNGQPQEGIIGIGGTNLSASQAGAGAIRYNYTTDKLEYSNGVAWNYLVESVNQRTIVVAKKAYNQPQTIYNGSKTKVNNWKKITDTNGEYNPNQGMFKPKRAGNYYVSLSLNFDFEEYYSTSINDNSYAEATIEVKRNGSVVMERKSTASFSSYNSPSYSPRRDSELGVFIATVLPLQKDDEVNIYIKHNMGVSKKLRVGNSHSDGFINFSVTEL